MPTPLASIVIATYRSRADHLSAAIASALDQTRHDIEVIVSDDSPDDRLRTLVAGFRDVRLRYRHNQPALGVARNHWVSFGEARGEFIAVLNHDDWLAPTFVERLADVLQQNPSAALAFCDHWIIDVRGRRLDAETDRNSMAWGRTSLEEGLHRPFVNLVGNQTIPMAMGALFRRSALPADLPQEAGPAYDLWLAYLLSRGERGAWYLRARLSAWRTHPENLTTEGGLPWLEGASACWQTIAYDPGCASIRELARRKAAAGHVDCAVRLWAQGRSEAALEHARQSVGVRLTAKGLAACLLPLLPARWAPARWAPRRAVGGRRHESGAPHPPHVPGLHQPGPFRALAG